MIVLDFTGKPEEYGVCQGALVLTQRPVAPDEREDYIDLMDRFEAIGSQIPGLPRRIYELDLTRSPAEVLVERSELKVLREAIDKAVWTPEGLRAVVKTLKWLEGMKPVPVTRREAEVLELPNQRG